MRKLEDYNNKRDFTKTKEPIGKIKKSAKKLRFVVQHHIATKDHYDLRLEYDGVLKSFAVPKGPSYSSKDKRLAIKVEDHPFLYRNFEGIIPKGEYGAGIVMVWDEGYYEVLDKSDFIKGPVKFILKGKRLKGTWTLVHFKDNNWLLFKEKDSYENYMDINKYKTSIKTGRTMEEIASSSKINVTNKDKIMYKKGKITKIDVFNYYEKVADRMLPYLENRIISTVRCPSGVEGNSFFKKHFEKENVGLKKIKLQNKKVLKDDYYYILNKEGLLNEVQMNGIEFHVGGSKVKSLDNPDIMVFDLDPDKKLTLEKVREGVKDLKKILDSLHLKSYLKTSGSKGYHVLVPIKEKINWEDFREIAKNIAILMETKWPLKYTSNIRLNKRKGKIFIDWVRNTKGATSVVPYSLRVRKNATVSMPIKWSELDKVKPNEITIDDALKRLKRKDPWFDFFL